MSSAFHGPVPDVRGGRERAADRDPFFLLTGALMNSGQITERLLLLSRELVAACAAASRKRRCSSA
jgi:hypothetical protein